MFRDEIILHQRSYRILDIIACILYHLMSYADIVCVVIFMFVQYIVFIFMWNKLYHTLPPDIKLNGMYTHDMRFAKSSKNLFYESVAFSILLTLNSCKYSQYRSSCRRPRSKSTTFCNSNLKIYMIFATHKSRPTFVPME